jgi:hypothetical protein
VSHPRLGQSREERQRCRARGNTLTHREGALLVAEPIAIEAGAVIVVAPSSSAIWITPVMDSTSERELSSGEKTSSQSSSAFTTAGAHLPFDVLAPHRAVVEGDRGALLEAELVGSGTTSPAETTTREA